MDTEPLPIMAIIGVGALFVAAIGVTVAATKHCETFIIRFVTIIITWAIPCLVVSAVGPSKLWLRILTATPPRIDKPTGSPTPSETVTPTPKGTRTPAPPIVGASPDGSNETTDRSPPFLRELKEALQKYLETADSGFQTPAPESTPTFQSSTPSEPRESEPRPRATPIDKNSYIYIANTTRVDLTIDVYEQPNWLEYEIRAGAGIRLASRFSNMFVRICHRVPYKKFHGQWTIYPRRKGAGPWLPKHELYVDQKHIIRLRTAGFVED